MAQSGLKETTAFGQLTLVGSGEYPVGVGESIRGIHPPLVVRVHPRLRRSSILILELELDQIVTEELFISQTQMLIPVILPF